MAEGVAFRDAGLVNGGLSERRNRPLDLDGPVFHVDTSSFAALDFDRLV